MPRDPEPVVLTVRALLLDMDGTLVDSDAVVERLWREWCADHGVDPERALRIAHGRQGDATMAELLPDRPEEENRADNEWLIRAQNEDMDGIVAVEGAPALLKSLDGFPHALVTSAPSDLAGNRMEAAGLPLPPVRITAEEVEKSKPDPDGFLKAAAGLGVAPGDCLVLEDSGAGIEAARNAGMQVVGVGPRAAEHDPDGHVQDLTELRVRRDPDGGDTAEIRVG